MDKEPDLTSRAGGVVFAVIFLVFALFLLSQLNAETKYSSGKQLFAQPRFWPGVGVVGMCLFGLAHAIAAWKARQSGAMAEIIIWTRALEFLCWFMAYVTLVPILGYLLATLIFTTVLAFRLGFRARRELLLAASMGFCVVLVFKTFLRVNIPSGALYEVLPGAIRNFMIANF